MHKIERNIPMPTHTGKWKKLASEMKVGDSVVLNSHSQACGLYTALDAIGRKMVQRKMDHDQFRCWRVK